MSDPEKLVADIEALGADLAEAKRAIATRIIGQENVVNLALAAMLSGGHTLLMGLPGLAKRCWLTRCPPSWGFRQTAFSLRLT